MSWAKKTGKNEDKKTASKREAVLQRKKVSDMSIENVKKEFEALGIADRILELDESSATVDLAAHALGCEPNQIAKTLSFQGAEGPILVVAAGQARIQNGKFKRTFGVKASMIKADEVEELVGHKVGGVCPFAVKDGVQVYLDESLKAFDSVYPACGSSSSAIKLSLPELEKYSKANGWVDVCKDAAGQA